MLPRFTPQWSNKMQTKSLMRGIAMALALGTAALPALTATAAAPTGAQDLQIQQIRNATLKIDYAGQTFLVDPMLAKKGTYPGFEGTFNSQLRNPLVELPMPVADVLDGVDAIIVSHTHLDHWDGGDHRHIPTDMPLFVQHAADAELIRGQGFTDVRILDGDAVFKGVRLTKTGGQHGTDQMYAVPDLAAFLGDAMGIVFQAPGAKTVYLVGDTIWRGEVERTLARFEPEVVILNAGDARLAGFTGGIIMGKDDVLRAAQAAPGATIVTTHMDAINHMTLSREALRYFVGQHGIQDRVRVPEDGETLDF